MPGTNCRFGPLKEDRRIGMFTMLCPDMLSVSVINGRAIIDASGLTFTLDTEKASFISEKLLAGCALARCQQHAPIDQCAHVGES
jgi:hypothetical protein